MTRQFGVPIVTVNDVIETPLTAGLTDNRIPERPPARSDDIGKTWYRSKVKIAWKNGLPKLAG